MVQHSAVKHLSEPRTLVSVAYLSFGWEQVGERFTKEIYATVLLLIRLFTFRYVCFDIYFLEIIASFFAISCSLASTSFVIILILIVAVVSRVLVVIE